MRKSQSVVVKKIQDWLQHPFVLVLLVITVRLVYVLILHFGFDFEVDGDYYDDIARNLVAGHGYVITPGGEPNLFRYPGYTYFLALLFALSGGSYIFLVAVQLLLDVSTFGLLYLIARNIFGRNTAVLTVLIATLYPFSALYVLRYTTEPLFTFLLAATMLFLTRGFLYGGVISFVVTGVLLGAAIWCRASLFYFMACLPVLAFLMMDSQRILVRLGAAMLTVVVAGGLLVPWGMRNLEVTGEFNLLGTAGGYSLWVGNFLPLDGRDFDELTPELAEDFKRHERRIADGEALFSPAGEKRFSQAAIDGWIDKPFASAGLVVRKAARFWFSIYKPNNRAYWVILLGTQAALLLLSVVGVLRGFREKCPHWHIIALVLYFNVLHAIVVATFRYSLPVMPYIIMFAAHGLLSVPFLKLLFFPSDPSPNST